MNARRESLRTSIAFIVLAAISAILLNIGIYRSDQGRATAERWTELENHGTSRLEAVRSVSVQVGQQAELMALDIRHVSDAREIERRLRAEADLLRWRDIAMLDAQGRVLVRARPDEPATEVPEELRLRALTGGRTALGVAPPGPHQFAAVVALVPVRDGSSLTGMLAAVAPLEPLVHDRLTRWPGFGPSAGAYLVGPDLEGAVVFSSAPADAGLPIGARGGSPDPRFRAAIIAAAGVESRVLDHPRGKGGPLWAVTRWVPELGCGLVVQSRYEDLENVHDAGVMGGLFALDIAMLGLVTGAILFWRRHYYTGLERRELELTRRHARQVQAVFDNAFDAILTFDGHGVIRTANPAAEKIFRRPCAELAGMSLSQVVRSEDEHGRSAFFGSGQVIRTVALHPGGGESPVELSAASAGEGDEVLTTVIARDISEQLAAETRIREFAQGLETSNRRLAELNAQLEEASRLKSEFLANTSHELRTPLNGMIGFLQLVLDGMCSSPDEERDFMRQALGCARHLLGLINDVLDIAKIEAGKLTLEIEPVDVRTLFDEVYTVTHVQAAQKGLTLTFETTAEDALPARGDFRKVKQVLINLIGNAIKFTAQGSVTVRAIEQRALGHYRFEVVDTGIGIPADRQDRIFEKFMQADGSTTRNFGGTGLGLSISRSLIELMGGIIGVHSEGMGHGTRMYFSLPVWRDEPEEALEAEPTDRIEGPAVGALVLVVEDDPAFRHLLKSVLHRCGHRTAEARHAEGGWYLARRLRPALVVLDYALACPDGASLRSGWDLAQRMNAEPDTRDIPLLFVTGFEDEIESLLRAAGNTRRPEHLVKPFEREVLLAKIESMLGGVGAERRMRILIADDDPSAVALARKVLPESRYLLEVANDGEECLEILNQQPNGFDLLLLDLVMPGMGGYQVLRALEQSPHRELPVLVITNFPEASSVEERRLIERGLVRDVLPKSAVHDNPLVLSQIIDWHLQTHPDLAPHVRRRDANGEMKNAEAA